MSVTVYTHCDDPESPSVQVIPAAADGSESRVAVVVGLDGISMSLRQARRLITDLAEALVTAGLHPTPEVRISDESDEGTPA